MTARLAGAAAAALVGVAGLSSWAEEPPATPPSVAGGPDGADRGGAGVAPSTPTDAEIERCVAAFADSQRSRREGKLIAARRELRDCASDRCPPPLAERCVRWLGEVEQALPTIIVAARDSSGADLLDIRVWLDGRLVAERLDGRPWPVDPGPHVLRFESQGRIVERRLLLLAETERNRRVELTVGPSRALAAGTGPEPAPVAEPPLSGPSGAPWIHPVAWGAFATGAAALVVAVTTGAVAWTRLSDIEARCPAGRCSPAEADDYRSAATLARVSTLGFIGGGAAVSVGVVSALALELPVARHEAGSTLVPVASLGFVGLRGQF